MHNIEYSHFYISHKFPYTCIYFEAQSFVFHYLYFEVRLLLNHQSTIR